MSGLFYWDTSTLVKLYASEPDSPAYRALMQARPERPVTSFLHRVELFYALRQKEDRGEIVAGAAARLFAEYERHLGEGRFHEIPWGGDVSDAARTALDACLAASRRRDFCRDHFARDNRFLHAPGSAVSRDHVD
jgi:uncharacterized protein with PIN domain